MLRTKLKGIIASLSLLAIFLLAVESVFWIFDIGMCSNTPTLKYRTPNEIYHHGFVPNSEGTFCQKDYEMFYKINSIGLRDDEVNMSKRNILLIGDSLVEGVGVNIEDAISEQLEAMLVQINQNLSVVNGGIAGTSPILEYLFLKEKYEEVKPELVIFILNQNDVFDDYHIVKNVSFSGGVYHYAKITNFDESGMITSVSAEKPSVSLFREFFIGFLGERSRAFRTFGIAFLELIGRYDHFIEGFEIGNIDVDRFYAIRSSDYVSDDDLLQHFNVTAGYILQIKKFLDARNTTLIIVTYPDAPFVSDFEWPGRIMWGVNSTTIDNRRYFDMVNSFCADFEINCIDATPFFKNTNELPLFYTTDEHPTSKGFKVLADSIFYNMVIQNII